MRSQPRNKGLETFVLYMYYVMCMFWIVLGMISGLVLGLVGSVVILRSRSDWSALRLIMSGF